MKAYEEIIDFIAAGSSSDSVSAFQPSEKARARAAELISKEKSGQLTSDEKTELEHYVQLEHLMRLAKARAKQYLKQ